MSDEEEKLCERSVSKNQCGVILGYWDHEETPALIQDLEHSVDVVERKCKNLLEELIYYKRYLEESEEAEVDLVALKKKNKRWKSVNLFSGSDPDIAFRKNLINLEETREIFEEKFREKLGNINKELGAAGQKLGLKDSIILFPADDYLRTLRGQMEHKAHKCWSEVRDRFIKLNLRFKRKTRSDSIVADIAGNEDFSKITRDELELYQKLSKLSLKRANGVKSKGRKMKFRCRKKCPGICEEPRKAESRQKDGKRRRGGRRRRRRRSSRRGKVSVVPEGGGDSRRSPREAEGAKVQEEGQRSGEAAAEEKVALGTVMRKFVPFTACSSTSRSYNIGLNIQQLLSLTKRGGWKSNVEKRYSASSWIGEEEVRRLEHGGKVSNLRKVRCKYTGRSPGGLMEYHESRMSRYTSGQKSMIKSECESKSAYAVGSKIMVSGCRRTDVFEIEKDEGLVCRENASGDGTCDGKCSKLNVDWTKVYRSFLETYRKYTSLKEKLSDKDLTPSSRQLKSLENEIERAMEKYKDFLEFYSKFLHLKHRLKSLKIGCEWKKFGPVTSFGSGCDRKAKVCRPTSSMAMKKALKEVEALQNKIRLVCD